MDILTTHDGVSASGTPYVLTARPHRENIALDLCVRGDRIGSCYMDPNVRPIPRDTDDLRKMAPAGASSYLMMVMAPGATDQHVTIFMGPEEAEKLGAALSRARDMNAARIEEARRAREAEIRGTRDVRTFLYVGGSGTSKEIVEAYPDESGKYAAPIHLRLGTLYELHQRLSDLPVFREDWRIKSAFPGHSNSLVEITEEERDALIEQSMEVEAREEDARQERGREHQDRIEALKAVHVEDDWVRAYKRYGGDSERAWEAEDEWASSIIRRYGRAIEVQDLARPDLRREVEEAGEILPPGA